MAIHFIVSQGKSERSFHCEVRMNRNGQEFGIAANVAPGVASALLGGPAAAVVQCVSDMLSTLHRAYPTEAMMAPFIRVIPVAIMASNREHSADRFNFQWEFPDNFGTVYVKDERTKETHTFPAVQAPAVANDDDNERGD